MAPRRNAHRDRPCHPRRRHGGAPPRALVMPVLTLAEAEEIVVAALTRAKTSPTNARSVARALVRAEAEGLKGHGLSRVPTYAAQARVGKIDGFATAQVTRPKPAIVAVDAG